MHHRHHDDSRTRQRQNYVLCKYCHDTDSVVVEIRTVYWQHFVELGCHNAQDDHSLVNISVCDRKTSKLLCHRIGMLEG